MFRKNKKTNGAVTHFLTMPKIVHIGNIAGLGHWTGGRELNPKISTQRGFQCCGSDYI
jgi:hypothetical protein